MRTQHVIELALAVGLSLRPANAAAQGGPGGPGGQVAQAAKCAALSSLQVSGFAVAITRADGVAAGPAARGRGATVDLPAHCRVDGMIDRRTGAEGKPYGIGFAIALPDAWNGRFLFQGGGGLNGTVGLPLGAQAAGDSPALVARFRGREHRHAVIRRPAARSTRRSCAISRRCSTSNTRRSDGSPSSRSRSSRGTTAVPPTARISRAARPAGAKRC